MMPRPQPFVPKMLEILAPFTLKAEFAPSTPSQDFKAQVRVRLLISH